MAKLNKKAYAAYEANEPKKVVDKEKAEASKKLGRSASHKDAEKLEPMKDKLKESKMGEKMLAKKKKK